MTFEQGTRYAPPEPDDGEWIAAALGEVSEGRVGGVGIEVEMTDGKTRRCKLWRVVDGIAEFAFERDDDVRVPCADITAFTLLRDAPIEHDHELR